jgi:hypothetical protein
MQHVAIETSKPSLGSPSTPPSVTGRSTVRVAPEAAARIVADRAAGVPLSDITGRLHLTPGEALAVLAGDGRR